ncbi:hypothetical protein [Massilia sp. TS11]|uniref:hypothetical protein n=1 Tax=Massilia sp. TS11 TaxID=2908003 RepID=UPI001EDC3906|nr:hypothetical protein [Massilia sp. TS11]MCG2584575.1 hypothetical protein [Massilia sp. TS11]
MEAEFDVTEDLVQQIDQARLLYILHGACLLFSAGAFNLIPVILNYMRRQRTNGLVQRHHAWMIRSFWIYAAMMCVGSLTLRFTVGGLIIIVGWIMMARNLYRGYRALNATEAPPERA